MNDVAVESYKPSDAEPFMNERQREYFRRKLIAWREAILLESRDTLAALQLESENHPDIADRASSETDRAIELRARDRQRKLIAKIEAALARIDDGSYGFCVETGEPISLRRLDARPIATLSVEAQERHERRENFPRRAGASPAAVLFPPSGAKRGLVLSRRVRPRNRFSPIAPHHRGAPSARLVAPEQAGHFRFEGIEAGKRIVGLRLRFLA